MLRLVDDSGFPDRPLSFIHHAPALKVEAENRAAARLSGFDARWVFAARTSQMLEGGRTALLTPDRRRRLVSLATTMGLRPFDAALIIAIVQDAARAGEPLTRDAQDRLAMVRPVREARPSDIGLLLLVSGFLATFLFAVMRVWLLG